MKKYYLGILLCFTAVMIANAQYTNIPDVNFEAALEALGYDDISGDGQVPTANIETVTFLSISGKNISDLTGIEEFTALTFLDCSFNTISNLDLSNNLQLVELYCFLNSISSLNLSNCTMLRILNCFNNDLVSIDLSHNTQLVSLQIFSNNLAGIDISNNVLLEDVNLSSNELTSIDVSNNTQLKNLFISDNNLQELDLTSLSIENITNLVARRNDNLTCISVNNPNYAYQNLISDSYEFSKRCGTYTYIADLNFESYLASLGLDDITGDYSIPTANIIGITSLDIQDNLNISTLQGIEAFVALESLTVNNNAVTSLDISENVGLKQLSCSNNALEVLEISNNTLLETLICNGNQISSIDMTTNTGLVSLNASNNPLLKLDLKTTVALESLHVNDTDIIQLDLTNNIVLEDLELTNGPLVSLNLKNGNNTNIVDIDLRNNPNLTCVVVDNINYTAGWTNVDAQLTFSDTECNIDAYTVIPDTFFEERLHDLGLDNIENDGRVPTAYIENLISLDISNSSISNITGIDDFNSLEILRINNTSISDLDLSGNTTIKELYAYRISSETLNVSDMTALEYLECYESGSVRNLIVTNATALKEMQVYRNGFTTLDVSTNTALEKLVCFEGPLQQLNTNGATNLQELIVYRTSLESLDVSNNKALERIECYDTNSLATINANGADALQELYAYRSGLTNIDVSTNTNLTLLHVYDCNNLLSVETNGLTNLSDLNIGGASLTSLDVSTNIGLRSLNVSFNNLVSLDLRNGNNPSLTDFNANNNDDLVCIMVDDVSYAQANFTNIDSGVTFSTTTCGYTLIPDANFESVLDGLGYDDISGDGRVPTALVEVVTNLNVFNGNISDLTGIEDFEALQTLSFTLNNISSIDLSNNIALESLICRDNNLTSLDLSSNTKLVDLYTNGNPLGSIDLSKNMALQNLGLGSCNLTDIDLSKNSALKLLDLYNNQLTSLNLSNNISLEELYLNNNALTSLNIRNGNNNNLSNFNVTNNPNLTCIEVDNVTYATGSFTNIDNTASFSEYCNGVVVSPSAILEGAFQVEGNTIVMHDDLRSNNYIPITSPYNADESFGDSVLDITGENAVVDWIQVQLRDVNDKTVVLESRSALLLRNGNIVDVDGRSSVPFDQSEGNYFVALAHRNHLTVVSNVALSLSGAATKINFTNSGNVQGGASALSSLGSAYNGMPLGDVDMNGQIQNADITNTILQIGISGYSIFDVDMNGQIQNADINIILQNIGKGEQF